MCFSGKNKTMHALLTMKAVVAKLQLQPVRLCDHVRGATMRAIGCNVQQHVAGQRGMPGKQGGPTCPAAYRAAGPLVAHLPSPCSLRCPVRGLDRPATVNRPFLRTGLPLHAC